MRIPLVAALSLLVGCPDPTAPPTRPIPPATTHTTTAPEPSAAPLASSPPSERDAGAMKITRIAPDCELAEGATCREGRVCPEGFHCTHMPAHWCVRGDCREGS